MFILREDVASGQRPRWAVPPLPPPTEEREGPRGGWAWLGDEAPASSPQAGLLHPGAPTPVPCLLSGPPPADALPSRLLAERVRVARVPNTPALLTVTLGRSAPWPPSGPARPPESGRGVFLGLQR